MQTVKGDCFFVGIKVRRILIWRDDLQDLQMEFNRIEL